AGASVDGVPLGPVGLALGSAAAAWLEWTLLRRRLDARVGRVAIGGGTVARIVAAALLAAAAGHGARLALGVLHPLLVAVLVAAAFGVVYLLAARALGLAEARALPLPFRRR